MMMNELLALLFGLQWWQIGGFAVVIGMVIGLKIYRSKQM